MDALREDFFAYSRFAEDENWNRARRHPGEESFEVRDRDLSSNSFPSWKSFSAAAASCACALPLERKHATTMGIARPHRLRASFSVTSSIICF
jgi:hypothetical protein